MKVTISVFGRFHAFYLAQQLHKYNHLHRLITSYPKFETVKYGIPREHITSLLPLEAIRRGWNRFPSLIRNRYNFQYVLAEAYDRLAARSIPRTTEILTGWSSFSLYSLRRAKEYGAITILERGSSHMLYQQQILREEYAKYGLDVQLAHPGIIEKELQEYQEATYISVPSLFVKRTFLARGIPEEKLIHVPYGVDISEFKPLPKEDHIFRVIHCGALSLRKGVHYLLQVFYELALKDSELWLIGRMVEEIRPFFEQYDNGKVFHKGPYPQKELYKYYAQGSVFCLASIEEGLAMVQPQAMACGLPVICTLNTGGEDIVRNGVDGFVIPAQDPKALKKKILWCYSNQEQCREMGESARKRIETGFSWDDYGKNMVRAYQRILLHRKDAETQS